MKRVRRVTWLALLAVALGFWSGPVVASARRPFGGSLRLPLLDPVRTTDPQRVASWSEWFVASQLHETLFRQEPDGRVVPSLAQGLPQISADGREWIITLRAGLEFHDGTPLTVDEIVTSWQRLLRPDTGSLHWWLLAPVEGAVGFRQGKLTRITGLERINRLCLRIRLVVPDNGFLQALSALPTAPLSMRDLLHKGGEPNPHPVGCGPFRRPADVDEIVDRLIPFLAHWRGRPFLDEVVFRTFDSPRSAALAFEVGDLHLSPESPGRKMAEAVTVDGSIDQQVFLVSNPVRIRDLPTGFPAAVATAIDRRSLVEYLVGVRGWATDEGLVLDPSEGSGVGLHGDISTAKDYFRGLAIARLGLPSMLEFPVREDDPFAIKLAERIQVNLADALASVFVLKLSVGEFKGRMKDHAFDFRLEQPLPLVRDAWMQSLHLAADIQGEEGVVELLRAAKSLPPDDSRAGVLRERVRGLVSRSTWMPLMVYGRSWVVRSAVHDFVSLSGGRIDLAQVWLVE